MKFILEIGCAFIVTGTVVLLPLYYDHIINERILRVMNKIGFGIVTTLLGIIAVSSCQTSIRLEKAETAAKIALEGGACQEKCPAYAGYDYKTKDVGDNTARDKCVVGCDAVLKEKIAQLLGKQ